MGTTTGPAPTMLCTACGSRPGTKDPMPYGRPTTAFLCDHCLTHATCELCGKARPIDEMIQFSTGWYCIGENMRRKPDATGSTNLYRCYLRGQQIDEDGASELVAEQESMYRSSC